MKLKEFGFHFVSLDIRQDSRKHDAVWKMILQVASKKGSLSFEKFDELTPEEKIKHLLSLQVDLRNGGIEDEFAKETIQSIIAIGDIQKENGVRGCHRYVISNCQSALHVIEIFVLARLLISD